MKTMKNWLLAVAVTGAMAWTGNAWGVSVTGEAALCRGGRGFALPQGKNGV